eukprot:UN21703
MFHGINQVTFVFVLKQLSIYYQTTIKVQNRMTWKSLRVLS